MLYFTQLNCIQFLQQDVEHLHGTRFYSDPGDLAMNTTDILMQKDNKKPMWCVE